MKKLLYPYPYVEREIIMRFIDVDVLIVGSGGAALRAALAIIEKDSAVISEK